MTLKWHCINHDKMNLLFVTFLPTNISSDLHKTSRKTLSAISVSTHDFARTQPLKNPLVGVIFWQQFKKTLSSSFIWFFRFSSSFYFLLLQMIYFSKDFKKVYSYALLWHCKHVLHRSTFCGGPAKFSIERKAERSFNELFKSSWTMNLFDFSFYPTMVWGIFSFSTRIHLIPSLYPFPEYIFILLQTFNLS